MNKPIRINPKLKKIFFSSILIFVFQLVMGQSWNPTTSTNDGVYTYWHSTFSGGPAGSAEISLDWVTNYADNTPVLGAGLYTEKLFGHTVDSGYMTNADTADLHALLLDYNFVEMMIDVVGAVEAADQFINSFLEE